MALMTGEQYIESIKKKTLPEKFHEMNLRALNFNI